MTTTEMSASTPASRGAGPLTTVFTTPDFCKVSGLRLFGVCHAVSYNNIMLIPEFQSLYWQNTETGPFSSSVCMPPRFHQLWDYSWGFYSPGICPTGYSKGCAFPTSLASTSLGMIYFGGPVVDGETVQVCCPTGYQCLTDTVSSYSKCISTDASDLAFAIQVRWKESDLSILETDPTVPGSKYSSPASVTATTTQSGASSTGSSGTVALETSKITSGTTSAANDGSDSDSATSGELSNHATIGIAAGASKSSQNCCAMVLNIRLRFTRSNVVLTVCSGVSFYIKRSAVLPMALQKTKTREQSWHPSLFHNITRKNSTRNRNFGKT